jgi:hypothetical protein
MCDCVLATEIIAANVFRELNESVGFQWIAKLEKIH